MTKAVSNKALKRWIQLEQQILWVALDSNQGK